MNVIYKAFETSSDKTEELDGVGIDIADFRAAAAELAKTAFGISNEFDRAYQRLEELSDASSPQMQTVVRQSRSNLRIAIQSITAEMRRFAEIGVGYIGGPRSE